LPPTIARAYVADVPEIESLQSDQAVYPPPPDFSARARIRSMEEYRFLYDRSMADPDSFWREMAAGLSWMAPFERVREWNPPYARWFLGGKLNASQNCLDRHLPTRGDKRAIVWEGEPGDRRTLTYRELHGEVCRLANALRGLGVQAGDRVGIYLPLIPEAIVAMLACARLGATHSVVFGGFSAEALRDRMDDAGAKVIITADYGFRKGQRVQLKAEVDKALERLPQVGHVLVVRRGEDAPKLDGPRDHSYDALIRAQPATCEPAAVDSEHPLFILYTSGTTGKPKGVVHATAGYLLQTSLTTRWVFDLREEDLYWCTADVGWVTGHSYLVYGPLCEGATVFMYEGALTHPSPGRIWSLIEGHRVNILYTAPTAIRSFVRAGDSYPRAHDLGSLRLLGTVGEPINPEAWQWYREVVGGGRCPIVDTWWQTETGAIAVSPLPGATPTKPGSATLPMPGIKPEILDEAGKPVPKGHGGGLFLGEPWPSMLRTVYRDPQRYVDQYFGQVPGKYFTGDGARFDADGYLWLMGRIDDVINVSGHRLGTAEIESALVLHSAVAEAAVVGRPDDLKGTAVVAFVTLKSGQTPTEALKQALRAHVQEQIGALARPDEIRFADALPKTRSGKIMRRLLRDVAAGNTTTGDTTTLEDLGALAALRQAEE
jgi:acetyl-CoA synthetase